MDESLAAFGLSRSLEPAKPFEVFAENWLTLEVFWASWNQWHKIVLRDQIIRDGIDWLQVEATLRLMKVKRANWPMIFTGLQAIEIAVLEHLREDS